MAERSRTAVWPQRRGGAQGQAAAWPGPVAALLHEQVRRRLRAWIMAEIAPGRLVPFLPVSFGSGVILYFAAAREPAGWAAAALLLVLVGATVAARRRPLAFALLLGASAVAAGFLVATVRTGVAAHPVLSRPVYATVTGTIERSEQRDRSDRLTLAVHDIRVPRHVTAPARIRVAVRKGVAPAVGSTVTLHARLSPPLPPLRPGGYDFARSMYFQGIGASGFALGRVTVAPGNAGDRTWGLGVRLQRLRDSIDARIRAAVPGDSGAIASALITGKRGAISDAINEAMYVSSLAHVLSISGYHMAVVAGVVFFVVRALLALSAALARHHPIKKWAALAALAATSFYLLLSGAEVATRRAYVMVAIVLIGVLVDRPALTFRTLSVAALVVLLMQPEAVVHPSFQMSFAATLALVAAYQNGLPALRPQKETALAARIALWGGREVLALVLASVVAGFATTPFAAYHFHRLAPYGVLANLLAMPVVSAVVMPAGLMGLATMPFGFDHLFWPLMGYGIQWLAGVTLWVAGLPGAVGRIHAFGTGPLLLASAGLILLCLLRTPLRFGGAVLIAAAAAWAVLVPMPEVWIAPDGTAVAVRGSHGRLSVAALRRDRFTVAEWLAADGDGRRPDDPSLSQGVRCDALGCIVGLPGGRRLALVGAVDAFAEDCRAAAVVVSRLTVPGPCGADQVFDRAALRRQGATALWAAAAGFAMQAARPVGTDRPWAPAAVRVEVRSSRPRLTPDATPAPENRAVEDGAAAPDEGEN